LSKRGSGLAAQLTGATVNFGWTVSGVGRYQSI